MSIQRYRNDNPRTASEIADAIEFELQQIAGDQPVVEGTQNYAYIMSIARTLAAQQEASLSELYDTAYIEDATGVELTKRAREIGVERQEAVAATGVVRFSRSTNATQDRVIPSGTTVSTGGEADVKFETTEVTTIESGTQTAAANVQAVEAGPSGNVGADTITVLVDKPPGVSSVTNPNPTGDPSYTLTGGQTQLTVGQARENDESLRERALDSAAIGGAGTAQSLELALENIDEVISADIFTNRSPNTVNNVDPWHTEVRVYGGEISTIAETLYDVLPLATLKSLDGGANGSLEEVTLDTGDLYGDITVSITRPIEQSLSIELDLVHTADYAGTVPAKNAIVNYIGGTTTDARTVVGLAQGEDVIVNEVENVVEDVQGVDAVTSSLIDDNNDGTSDTTTDSDGVEVYAVPDSEVAVVNADDVIINETQRS